VDSLIPSPTPADWRAPLRGIRFRLAVRLGRSGARAHRVTDTMPRPTTTGTRDLLLTCEAPLANPRSEQPRTRLARDPLPYLPEPLPAAAGTGGAPSPATPHRPRASGGIPSSLGPRGRSPPPPLPPPGGSPASPTRRSTDVPGNRSACSVGSKCLLGLVRSFNLKSALVDRLDPSRAHEAVELRARKIRVFFLCSVLLIF